jgi:hypothetical protein
MAKLPLMCRAPSRQFFFAECQQQKALGKEVFANEIFAVYPLPSAALGKACVSSSGALCQRQALRQ